MKKIRIALVLVLIITVLMIPLFSFAKAGSIASAVSTVGQVHSFTFVLESSGIKAKGAVDITNTASPKISLHYDTVRFFQEDSKDHKINGDVVIIGNTEYQRMSVQGLGSAHEFAYDNTWVQFDRTQVASTSLGFISIEELRVFITADQLTRYALDSFVSLKSISAVPALLSFTQAPKTEKVRGIATNKYHSVLDKATVAPYLDANQVAMGDQQSMVKSFISQLLYVNPSLDIWLSSASGLPRKIQISAPKTLDISVYFENYNKKVSILAPKGAKSAVDIIHETNSFVGIGTYLRQTTGGVMISQTIASSPASRAGLANGDLILKVNGADARSMTSQQVADLTTGALNTQVTLTILKKDTTQSIDITLNREKVEVPSVLK